MVYLGDFKEEKERELTEIKELSEILRTQEMNKSYHPLEGRNMEKLKNYCIDKGFVVEDFHKVSKWKYHTTKVNVYMIWNGYAVLENIRHIQRGRKWFTQRKNIFVIWIEGDTLQWKAISGQFYAEMRKDFLEGGNPIDRFLKWAQSGKSIEVWDFPPVENYNIR